MPRRLLKLWILTSSTMANGAEMALSCRGVRNVVTTVTDGTLKAQPLVPHVHALATSEPLATQRTCHTLPLPNGSKATRWSAGRWVWRLGFITPHWRCAALSLLLDRQRSVWPPARSRTTSQGCTFSAPRTWRTRIAFRISTRQITSPSSQCWRTATSDSPSKHETWGNISRTERPDVPFPIGNSCNALNLSLLSACCCRRTAVCSLATLWSADCFRIRRGTWCCYTWRMRVASWRRRRQLASAPACCTPVTSRAERWAEAARLWLVPSCKIATVAFEECRSCCDLTSFCRACGFTVIWARRSCLRPLQPPQQTLGSPCVKLARHRAS